VLAYIPCNSDQGKQDIKHSGNKSSNTLFHAARNWISISILVVDTSFLIVAWKWEARQISKCDDVAKPCKTM